MNTDTNTFSMSYEEVQSTVAQLSKYADAIREELDQVTVASTNVSDGAWKGSSAEMYKSTFDTLRPKFDMFYSKIVECVDYLNKAIAKNKETDTQVSSTFE